MIDPIRAKFIEEAEDLIQELEKSILALEKTPEDASLIENSFRAMHTLKGSGAMFGFELISRLTHDLETIFDFVREGSVSISSRILNITLLSVDQLKLLLHNDEALNSGEKNDFDELLAKVRNLIDEFSGGHSLVEASEDASGNSESEGIATYYIVFKPDQNILRDGTNPLYLLEDLCAMGDCKVISHCGDIPPIDAIEEVNCYVYWEVFLASSAGEQAIQDVFMFVGPENSLEIHKLAEVDLFSHNKFVEQINSLNPDNSIGVEELKRFISTLLQTTNTSAVKEGGQKWLQRKRMPLVSGWPARNWTD